MAQFLTQFKATVSRNPQLIADKPTAYKTLVRTEREAADYHKWRESTAFFKMCNWLREEIQKSVATPRNTHEAIDFYKSPNTSGFRLHPALSPFSDAAVTYFFDFLKNRLTQLDYQAKSETLIFERDYWQEKVHRHTLRTLNTEGGHFAEIRVELLLKDNRLCQLRMDANVPNTDLPHSTDDFERLFEALLA
jgi:hypothetical protein